MDKSLELISSYSASLSYDDLPASAVRAAKHRLIDSTGCALCTYLWEPCKLVRSLCFPTESPLTARVFGSLARTTPEMAAFANSTMVRTADWNDSYRIKRAAHVSDAIPAVLAAAEAVHADGKSLITSIALAYELGVCFIEKIATMKDWHPDPCALAAVLASAMGAGKILGLTKEQLANAASLALVPNINLGVRLQGEHSMYKEVYAGMSARQGLFAALMARAGITGPVGAIEDEQGLKSMTDTIQFEPLAGKGTQFAVERTELKAFPARDALQLAIETALELRKKVSPDKIESMHIWTITSPAAVAATVPEVWAPQTAETADHSLPFCIAAALIDGDVTPESYSRARFRDPDILKLIGKMRIDEDLEYTKQAPDKRNYRIEAKTRTGETIVAHKSVTAEELRKGWTDEQVDAKFRRATYGILTPVQIQASLDLMWHLEKVADVSQIVDNFQV